MSSVQLGYECWNKIETPFSKKLLELDDCSKGSGCQPPIDDVQKVPTPAVAQSAFWHRTAVAD